MGGIQLMRHFFDRVEWVSISRQVLSGNLA